MEELAGTDDGDSAEEAQATVARMLPDDDDRASVVERVAGALGLTDVPPHPGRPSGPIRKLLEAAAARQPLVVLFEDVHWAEPTFLELIEYLAGDDPRLPVLMVAVDPNRPPRRPAGLRRGRPRRQAVELQPLSGAESRALIEHLIGGAGAAPALSERVVQGRGGQPAVRRGARAHAGRPAPLDRTPSVLAMPPPSTPCWPRAWTGSTRASAR